MKLCVKCGQCKPLADFSNSRGAKDGKQHHCKVCVSGAIKGTGYHTDYYHTKRKHNDAYIVATKISGGFRRYLRLGYAYSDDSKMCKYLGAPFFEVCRHIESTFSPEMHWGNRGSVWVIDHHIPKAYGSTVEDGYILSHFLNLRAALVEDNYKKSKWIPDDAEVVYKKIKNSHKFLQELLENHGENK